MGQGCGIVTAVAQVTAMTHVRSPAREDAVGTAKKTKKKQKTKNKERSLKGYREKCLSSFWVMEL